MEILKINWITQLKIKIINCHRKITIILALKNILPIPFSINCLLTDNDSLQLHPMKGMLN